MIELEPKKKRMASSLETMETFSPILLTSFRARFSLTKSYEMRTLLEPIDVSSNNEVDPLPCVSIPPDIQPKDGYISQRRSNSIM